MSSVLDALYVVSTRYAITDFISLISPTLSIDLNNRLKRESLFDITFLVCAVNSFKIGDNSYSVRSTLPASAHESMNPSIAG